MRRKLQNTQKGFTIIEVMIVLAIAALILLIVLLAVPALQRNSRNTAIKNDASAVVGGVSEFASNNDGKTPKGGGTPNSSCSAGNISLAAGSSTTPSKPKIQGSTATDCQYTGGHKYDLTNSDTGKLFINFGAKCPDTVSDQTVETVTSTRSTAVVYAIETNSDILAKCVDG